MSQYTEMSHDSGMSSGSSEVRIESCDGIPKRCQLCGKKVKLLISHSKANPLRKYFRCEYAAAHKLSGDNHYFKWMNYAVHEEVIKMAPSLEILQKDVAEIKARIVEVEKMVTEKMEEQARTVKFACGAVFVGCLSMLVMSRLF